MWPIQNSNSATIRDILEHNRQSSLQILCIGKEGLVHGMGTEFSMGAHMVKSVPLVHKRG